MKNCKIAIRTIIATAAVIVGCAILAGCGGSSGGYSNSWLYPEDVSTVYLEMFDSDGFRRGHEYVLTDAIAKRIEAETPYKLVTDRNRADTVLTGRVSVEQSLLARERHTGRALEQETLAVVMVTWKNLKTGQVLVNNERVTGAASYSPKLGQSFDYAADVAVNRAAKKVVELMEKKW